jgi:hypothetical protein
LRDVEQKVKEIDSFVNYRFKEEDVDFIVKEKKRFAKDQNRYVEKKLVLLKERERAQEENNTQRVKELDEDIAELNQRANDLEKKQKGKFTMIAYKNSSHFIFVYSI